MILFPAVGASRLITLLKGVILKKTGGNIPKTLTSDFVSFISVPSQR
jgi:hypothetical protein